MAVPSKKDLLENQRTQAALNYFKDVEAHLAAIKLEAKNNPKITPFTNYIEKRLAEAKYRQAHPSRFFSRVYNSIWATLTGMDYKLKITTSFKLINMQLGKDIRLTGDELDATKDGRLKDTVKHVLKTPDHGLEPLKAQLNRQLLRNLREVPRR